MTPGPGRDGLSELARDGSVVPERVARVVCHAVADVPFLVVALVQAAQGWRPTSDYAIITIRSWGVLTSRSPLLGEFTQATSCAGHAAFSPGPLQYWMLALPVRMDSAHGVLWGAALWCAIGMAVCVEGAWAVRGASGGLAVAAFVIVLAATRPAVLVNPMWNPYFGVVWFAAACTVAWAVGRGRLRWWPVLVLSASVAAQSHLEYAVPAASLAILAPLPGIRRRAGAHREAGARGGARARRFWGWVPAGLAVGAACWAVPLVQQLTGHPGNVTVLLRCVGAHRVIGGRFGLEALASSVVPPPLWFHLPPVSAHGLLDSLRAQSAGVGIAVLAVLLTISVLAWLVRSKDLAVLAGVALLAAGTTVWEISRQPASATTELAYLDVVLWPVGMLVWGVVVLVVAELASRGIRLPRRRVVLGGDEAPEQGAHGARPFARWHSRAVLLVAVSAVVLAGGTANAAILASGATNQAGEEVGGPGTFRGVAEAAADAQRLVPRGPLVVAVSAPDWISSYALLYGTVWALVCQGRQATPPRSFTAPIDPPLVGVAGEPSVTLIVRADGSVAGATLTRHR